MKKYFTKYLPVEEEIKEGDKVYWTDPEGLTSQLNTAIEVTEDMIFMSEPDSSEIEAFSHEVQKVKLFLCSRDIQVGDKGFNTVKNEYFICNEVGTGMYFSKPEGEYFSTAQLKENCFKTVGEVPSEAIWVKEGDEFDEEEVKKLLGIVKR